MSSSPSIASRPGLDPDTILIGIGNNGRGDDGLGWAFLDLIKQYPECGGRIEYRYQLQVQDAAMISRAPRVIFVDSYKGELPGGFQWKPCKPARNFEFTTHVLAPGAVMHLCEDLYGKAPRADLLLIQGTSWDLQLGLTPGAKTRLDNAVQFFKDNVLG